MRYTSGSTNFHNLGLAFVIALLLGGVAASKAASEPSPSADSDLICHTSDPQDCYPRVFQPTHEFQIVHDDQQIPSGLHVRMDIWSGKKEAKINVPDEKRPDLEGLPVDQAVVLVDQPEDDAPRIPKGAPEYESVGTVKGPQHEAVGFAEGLEILRSGKSDSQQVLNQALEGLEELAHDIYYGLKIVEDPEVVRALFCMMADHTAPSAEEAVPSDQQAAAILGSALQNNPTALKQIVKQWPDFIVHQCPKSGKTIKDSVFSVVAAQQPDSTVDAKQSASKAKAKVAAINGLIKDDLIRNDFLQSHGMSSLLRVLVAEGKEWNGAQRKAGQLVLDNFLDEDMGAKLGQWPKTPRTDDGKCKTSHEESAGSPSPEEGCWDYYVARIVNANKADMSHWSRDLQTRLAKARKTKSKAEL